MQISAITLGTTDQARAIAFYTEVLGCEPRLDRAGVAYFALQGSWLALYPRDELAAYCGVVDSAPATGDEPFRAVTLSVNLATRTSVDELVARAAAAGARIVQSPAEVSWGGYVAWIADADGHLWEFVFNPKLPGGHNG